MPVFTAKIVENKMKKRDLEIYIHIPFCVKKCAYCDFLSGPAGREEQELYVQELLKEIAGFSDSDQYCVVSVFFGGGTPSVLKADQIGQILELLKEKFAFAEEAEVSIECNPGTADSRKLEQYRAYGINRISFGLQSADNKELALLGRIHTWEQFLETYEEARKAGFSNINVDLMSSLPGQSVQSWEQTLDKVLALAPEHISAYSLIIEEGTPFFETYGEDVRLQEEGEMPRYLPSEEAERNMYHMTEEKLMAAGMYRYEISNYAKTGYECRHNVGYWIGTEYVGFGLGASSYLKSESEKKRFRDKSAYMPDTCVRRIQNTQNMEQYLSGGWTQPETEELSREEQMSEFMFLGLRMMQGVSEEEFGSRFGTDMEEIYGSVLKQQCSLGLLERKDGWIRLTAKGVDLSNMVMAEFLL